VRPLEGVIIFDLTFSTGVFLTLYWLTLFILLKERAVRQQLLIPVATLLLCIATAVSAITPFRKIAQYDYCQHLIIDLVRALEAFVFDGDTIAGADAYYSNLASPLELAKTALYITQPTLADAVLVSFSARHCIFFLSKAVGLAMLSAQ